MSSKLGPIFDKQSSVCLLLNAESFYDCAKLSLASTHHDELLKYIPGHKSFPRPAIYANACQAIELALKAYLRASGDTVQECRSQGGQNGHDLVCLFDAVHRKGGHISLSTEDYDRLEVLSEMYRRKQFDYPDNTLNRGAPSCNCAVEIANAVIQGVTPFCRQNKYRHLDKSSAFHGYQAQVDQKRK